MKIVGGEYPEYIAKAWCGGKVLRGSEKSRHKSSYAK
jgi:hypothetical protein